LCDGTNVNVNQAEFIYNVFFQVKWSFRRNFGSVI
jgi:hypothetical protein